MNNEIKEKLEQWVKKTYIRLFTGYSCKDITHKDDNEDIFNLGYSAARSLMAYEVGCILGMELEEPIEPDEDW